MTTNIQGGCVIDLIPGKIDSNAKWAFTAGQCHALALALHEQTGWQIVAIKGGVFGGIPHVVCRRSTDNQLVDITGVIDPEQWGEETIDLIPDDVLLKTPILRQCGYLEPDIKAARCFVKPLLSKLEERANR